MKTIFHLCADIGSDSQPYKDAGYNVIKVGKKIGVENVGLGRSSQWMMEVYGIIANPVCTEFTIARGHHKKGDHLTRRERETTSFRPLLR